MGAGLGAPVRSGCLGIRSKSHGSGLFISE